MNWQKIKDECPKAYKLWDIRKKLLSRIVPDRDLFGFFDEKGIIGSIIFDGGKFIPKISVIDSEGLAESGIYSSFDSRKDAEDTLFALEFEILEQQLSQLSNKESKG